jgi:hypothetical protein
MNIVPLELLLFSTDPRLAVTAERSGVDGFIVDWECKGKSERQRGQDMEVNADTPEDLSNIVAAVNRPVIVRINGIGKHSKEEIDLALELGANGVMLPMAGCAQEVESFLDLVEGRARTIVQIETQGLIDDLARFADLDWDSAYVGLHDLMLSRAASSMWQALIDGTVENVFRILRGRAVGFAGATVIGGGHPIRFTQILHELSRLGAQLTFLRRSFRREMLDRDMAVEIDAIRAAWSASCRRGGEAVRADKAALYANLRGLVEV